MLIKSYEQKISIISIYIKIFVIDIVGGEEFYGLSFASSCRDGNATLGNGMHEELTSILGYICNRSFSIGEDGFGTRGVTSFCKLFRRYQDPEGEVHTSRDYLCNTDAKFKGGYFSTQCQKAIFLCRSYGCSSPGLVCRVSMSL